MFDSYPSHKCENFSKTKENGKTMKCQRKTLIPIADAYEPSFFFSDMSLLLSVHNSYINTNKYNMDRACSLGKAKKHRLLISTIQST